MSTKRRYGVGVCRDCDIDFTFLKPNGNKKEFFCPSCGDNFNLEFIRDIWVEKPTNHRKSWTQLEDDIIIEARKRGIPYYEIEVEGRNRNSIYRRWYRLNRRGICR